MNLGEGGMLRREGLQLITKIPSDLTVVGGGNVNTNYGTYHFNMGPTQTGKFHEMNVVKMNSVTSKFTTYELNEIIQEYKESLAPSKPNEPLMWKVLEFSC